MDLDAAVKIARETEQANVIWKNAIDDLLAIRNKKGNDYGKKTDNMSNLKQTEKLGIPAWVGCIIRAEDKNSRVNNMIAGTKLVNESVSDSFLDRANYFLLAGSLYQKRIDPVAYWDDMFSEVVHMNSSVYDNWQHYHERSNECLAPVVKYARFRSRLGLFQYLLPKKYIRRYLVNACMYSLCAYGSYTHFVGET